MSAPPPPSPGPRAQRLSQIYAASLTRTLDRLTYDQVASCFPTIGPAVLREVHAQMVAKLRDKSEREFASILGSRDVVAKLNALEGVVARAQEERGKTGGGGGGEAIPTPPHVLPPNDILRAHLVPLLAPHAAALEANLTDARAQNAALAERIRGQRAEMAALLDELDGAVGDIAGANAVLGSVVDELAAEARGVEAALGGS